MTGSSSNNSNDGNPTIVDFDDGHIPENFAGSANAKTQLVRYKSFVDDRTPMVHVIDEALPCALVDALYDATTTTDSDKPWGTYVTRDQLNEYRTKHITGNHNHSKNSCENSAGAKASTKMDSPSQDRSSLAVAAAAHYLDHALQQQQSRTQKEQSPRVQTYTSPTSSSSAERQQDCVWTDSDHATVFHGVAVWALASTPGAHVPYHLDYAEQIRYERNLIVPPLLAGTLQCTRTTKIKGGDLGVCFGGLEHYHKHGYKGAKQQQQQQKSDNKNNKESDDTETNKKEEDWIKVPYRYNRMIIKSGHLPHHSTRVEVLEPYTVKRVIVGFNVFGHDYGPLVQQAPEHSEVFRRKVALQRALLQSTSSANNNYNKSGGGISVQALQANKGLSKLLVLAKRAKIKYELAQAQQQLDDDLDEYLMTSKENNGITVEALMKQFGNAQGSWPSPVDVQVHINQRLSQDDQENRRRRLCLQTDNDTSNEIESHKNATKNRMVSPQDLVFLTPEQ